MDGFKHIKARNGKLLHNVKDGDKYKELVKPTSAMMNTYNTILARA